MKFLIIALSLLASACATNQDIQNLQAQIDATNANVAQVNGKTNAAFQKAETAEANSLNTRNVVINAFNNMNHKLDRIYAKRHRVHKAK